jgi:hypothetical protein
MVRTTTHFKRTTTDRITRAAPRDTQLKESSVYSFVSSLIGGLILKVESCRLQLFVQPLE